MVVYYIYITYCTNFEGKNTFVGKYKTSLTNMFSAVGTYTHRRQKTDIYTDLVNKFSFYLWGCIKFNSNSISTSKPCHSFVDRVITFAFTHHQYVKKNNEGNVIANWNCLQFLMKYAKSARLMWPKLKGMWCSVLTTVLHLPPTTSIAVIYNGNEKQYLS